MPSEFSPPEETSYDLWVEKTNLDGLVLSGVAYGVLVTLFFQCLQLQLYSPYYSFRTKCIWATYTCALFVLGTLGFASNTKFNEMTYIEYRNYPGGPNAFTVEHYSDPVNLLSFTSYTVMSWVADGFLLFRFLVMSDRNYILFIFPALIFFGSVSSSIALIIAITHSNDTFWGVASLNFGIAYWSLSISLNIIITLFITFQILRVKSAVQASLGAQAAATYTSLTAIIVESAALYSIWGLVFIISYARGTAFQNLVLPSLGQVQGIAPLLIVLRASSGNAWTQDAMSNSAALGPSRLRAYSATYSSGSTAMSLQHMKSAPEGLEVTVSKTTISIAEHDVEAGSSKLSSKVD